MIRGRARDLLSQARHWKHPRGTADVRTKQNSLYYYAVRVFVLVMNIPSFK